MWMMRAKVQNRKGVVVFPTGLYLYLYLYLPSLRLSRVFPRRPDSAVLGSPILCCCTESFWFAVPFLILWGCEVF